MVDVDSDNTNHEPDYGPDGTGYYEDYEDNIEDDPEEDGRWVNVNHDNDDLDNGTDFLDYVDYDNEEEDDFVRMRVCFEGPPEVKRNGSVRVSYFSWDAVGAVPTPQPGIYPLARLWKKDGKTRRDPKSASLGGDYIDGWQNGEPCEYTLAELGLHESDQVNYWIEGIFPGTALQERFLFEVDPDGPTQYVDQRVPIDAVRCKILYPKVVVLDAGHGSRWTGSVLTIEDESYPVHEEDVALEVVKVAATELALGPTPLPTVIFTRETSANLNLLSRFADLADRARVALKHNADVFVSIHFDAQGGSVNHTKSYMRRYWGKDGGVKVNYLPPILSQVPTCIPQTMCPRNRLFERICEAINNEGDNGDQYGAFVVLRCNVRRAVLVEVEAFDHPDAEVFLSPTPKAEHIEDVGRAVAHAIQTSLAVLAPMAAQTPPPEKWYYNRSKPQTDDPEPPGNSNCSACP